MTDWTRARGEGRGRRAQGVLSLVWRSLLPFAWRGGPVRLGIVPGRGSLDCPVQLLQVEACCWGKEHGRG